MSATSVWRRSCGHFNWSPRAGGYWEFVAPDTAWYPIGCDASGNDTSDSAEFIWSQEFASISEDSDLTIGADGPHFINGMTGAQSLGNTEAYFAARLYDVTNERQVAFIPSEFGPSQWKFQANAGIAGYQWPPADARLQIQVASTRSFESWGIAPYPFGKIRLYSLNIQAMR